MKESRESFHATKISQSPLKPLEPDVSFAYFVSRALTYFPNVNGNNAAFIEHGYKETRGMTEVIGTEDGFPFGLVNTNHSVGPGKINHVIGSIRKEKNIPGVGIDIMGQIDKRACAAFEIEPEEIASGEFSDVSIEIWCDRDKSTFVAMTNPSSDKLEDQKCFTAEEAASLGIRRTRWSEPDPYLYEGKVVVELCSPIRCRGVALVPDPADKTANVFEVAASMEQQQTEDAAKKASAEAHPEPYGPDADYADPGFRGKKRYPTDTEAHVRAALSYWGNPSNRSKYAAQDQQHITNAIQKAKEKFGIGDNDEEKSGFSTTDIPDLSPTASYYDSVTPVTETDACTGDLPDDAYADVHFNPEEDESERRFPLYASAKSHADGVPHKGLLKAALQAHSDGRTRDPKAALQKLKLAHSQLHGENMDKNEELAAALASANSAKDELAATITTKDGEIATLTQQVTTLTEEVASLKSQIAARDAEELANKRFATLAAVEGFTVTDEEKASLIEALKTEDDTKFENRVLTVKLAAAEEKAAKAKTAPTQESASGETEEDAALHAAGEQGLDIFAPSIPKAAKTKFSDLV
jgi:hypothetical protein